MFTFENGEIPEAVKLSLQELRDSVGEDVWMIEDYINDLQECIVNLEKDKPKEGITLTKEQSKVWMNNYYR